MPRKIVEVRRWELVAPYLAVCVAFVIGLVFLTRNANRTTQLSLENARVLRVLTENRIEVVRALNARDETTCRSRHATAAFIREFLAEHHARLTSLDLRLLGLVDCTSLPRLPTVTPPPAPERRRGR